MYKSDKLFVLIVKFSPKKWPCVVVAFPLPGLVDNGPGVCEVNSKVPV